MLQQRQTSETLVGGGVPTGRVNLLNWDGKGAPDGLFPQGRADRTEDDAPDEEVRS